VLQAACNPLGFTCQEHRPGDVCARLCYRRLGECRHRPSSAHHLRLSCHHESVASSRSTARAWSGGCLTPGDAPQRARGPCCTRPPSIRAA